MQENNQEVTNVVSLVKMVNLSSVSSSFILMNSAFLYIYINIYISGLRKTGKIAGLDRN